MIGSCTSCLYTSIEIHWTAPSSSSDKDRRITHTSVCPLSNVTTLKLQSLSVLKKGTTGLIFYHLIMMLVTTWGRCSPKCRRWWSRSRACCHRGRPCPCRPSAASSGCTTPWAPRCSQSWPPSRSATRLEASLATSVPGSCSRPGRVVGEVLISDCC